MFGAPIDLAEARLLRDALNGVEYRFGCEEEKFGGRYVMKPEGLFRQPVGGAAELLFGYIGVRGPAFDRRARKWGLLVRFTDPDGEEVRFIVPFNMLERRNFDVPRFLAARGLRIGPGRAAWRAVREYLQSFAIHAQRARNLERDTGVEWVEGRAPAERAPSPSARRAGARLSGDAAAIAWCGTKGKQL